jgi:23S rRNA pseudouridine1911/1915/1917 synthase
MSHLGHSLIGDQVYGHNRRKAARLESDLVNQFPRQALHAYQIGFIHPVSKQEMGFSAALPQDLVGLLDELRKQSN